MSKPRQTVNTNKCSRAFKHDIVFVLFDEEGDIYKIYERAQSATQACIKINGRVKIATLSRYAARPS